MHVDFAGPFLRSMFLLLVDAQSKWPEVVPMQSATATKTFECLRTIFARHGLPEQLVSDNGPQFISEQFQDFLQGNGIQHIRSTPYHPSTNGLVERFVHTFKHAMRASETPFSLNERLQRFLLTYRTTPHATTHESPGMLLQGRPLRTRLHLLRPDASRHVVAKQHTQAGESKVLAQPRQLDIGETCLALDYRPGQGTWIAGTIATSNGLTYEVEVSPGILWRCHIDQLRSSTIAPAPKIDSAPLSLSAPLPYSQGGENVRSKIETAISQPAAPYSSASFDTQPDHAHVTSPKPACLPPTPS